MRYIYHDPLSCETMWTLPPSLIGNQLIDNISSLKSANKKMEGGKKLANWGFTTGNSAVVNTKLTFYLNQKGWYVTKNQIYKQDEFKSQCTHMLTGQALIINQNNWWTDRIHFSLVCAVKKFLWAEENVFFIFLY